MSEKIKIPELDIEVEDVYDYNECASEHLTGFCEALEHAGETRPIDDEYFSKEEGFSFLWTAEAIKLIETEIKRLESIGVKYFGLTLELSIKSYMFKQP